MQHVNANTYVSIGVLVVLLSGFGIVVKGINDTKTETTTMKSALEVTAITNKNELVTKIDKLESRINNLESAKNSWTATDMFKWAVHLQQSNPQIKVPEPEVNTK